MKRNVIYTIVLLMLGLPLQGSSNSMETSADSTGVEYIRPLKIPVSLSASYGELRRNHFHSGVDLRVGGVIGEPIRAVADGYLSRVSISPYGYGNALYIAHPDGKTSLYGHMDHFSDKITDYVVERQFEMKSFAVNLYLKRDAIPVKRGEIIGYVGNTGSSGGPHLHFEIRRTSDQKPLNALARGYVSVEDDLAPFIRDVAFYGYDRETLSGWKVASRKGETTEVIRVPECFYVAVDAYDRQNGTSSKLGIEIYRVLVDGETVFEMKTGETSFELTRYINSLVEYAEMDAQGRSYIKTLKDAGNRLSDKCRYINDGLIELPDSEVHTVTVDLHDEHGNVTKRKFSVRKDASLKDPEERSRDCYMRYDLPQSYVGSYSSLGMEGGYGILIDKGTLYAPVYFHAAVEPAPEGSFSPLVKLFDSRVPVQKSFSFSMDLDSVPEGMTDKLVMARVSASGRLSSAGGKMISGKTMEAHLKAFGDYCVVLDTVPPVVSAEFADRIRLSGNEKLVFRISDDFSGILDFNVYVDGRWTLADYDPKTRKVVVKTRYSRIEKTGGVHQMKIVVRDGVYNTTELKRQVIF